MRYVLFIMLLCMTMSAQGMSRANMCHLHPFTMSMTLSIPHAAKAPVASTKHYLNHPVIVLNRPINKLLKWTLPLHPSSNHATMAYILVEVAKHAVKHKVDPVLALAVMSVESNFNALAASPT